MKKILSLVLVAAMMLSLVVFAPAASAADGYSVEVTDALAHAGDVVTVDVIVTTPSTLNNVQLVLDYDESKLTLHNKIGEGVNFASNFKGNLAATATTADEKKEIDFQFGCAVDGSAPDATEGYKLLTLTFTVKEGALGDAFVRVVPLAGNTNIYINATNNALLAVSDFESIGGTISIVPDEYSTVVFPKETSADLLDWKEDGGVVVINGFMDESVAELVIPAYIEGMPVTKIARRAFRNDSTIEFLVIPETVEIINQQAFQGIAENAVAYVMAEEAEFGATAIEATIYSSATSTAKAYAEDEELPWFEYNAPTNTVSVNVDGEVVSYGFSGDTITAPGASVANGKAIVAWMVNGSVVAPGAEVAVDGDVSFEAVTVGFATENGASIKVVDTAADTALRFTAALNKADYAALEEIYGAENVSHGMLIVPQQYIKRAGAFTHAALEAAGLQMLDYEMTGCYVETADEYILAASVKGFSAATRAKNPRFAAVGYIAITVGEETTYVYSDYDISTARDAKFVLTETLKTATGDAKTWMTTLLGTFD